MAEISAFAALAMLVVAIGGPVAVLVIGYRAVKWALIGLFCSATLGLPSAALSEPADFRGTTLIMVVLVFVFGLIAINIAGAARAPRRVR